MSRKERILIVKPTPGTDNETEVFAFPYFGCPHCKGNGHHDHSGWKAKFHVGEEDLAPDCKRCNGTGRLLANITIKWVAEPNVF